MSKKNEHWLKQFFESGTFRLLTIAIMGSAYWWDLKTDVAVIKEGQRYMEQRVERLERNTDNKKEIALIQYQKCATEPKEVKLKK